MSSVHGAEDMDLTFYCNNLPRILSRMQSRKPFTQILKSIYLSFCLSIYLSIYLWLYSPYGPWPLFQFSDLYTIGRTPCTGISPWQVRYLHTEQQEHRINHTDIHALIGIRTHDLSVRAREDGSCLRPRDRCDRPDIKMVVLKLRCVHTVNPGRRVFDRKFTEVNLVRCVVSKTFILQSSTTISKCPSHFPLGITAPSCWGNFLKGLR
jgi:hypothetical protein